MRVLACALLLGLLATPVSASRALEGPAYVALPGGTFTSVLPADGKSASAQVAPFRLRTTPVTNAQFLAFVKRNQQWQRGKIAAAFADDRYLSHWATAETLGDAALPQQPVTRVSWFAAQAFCEGEQARLPTWYEWEYAAAADATRSDARGDPAWRERVLGWYGRPSNAPLPAVGGTADVHGVRDLNGLVWEWVDDFNALLVSNDGREQNGADTLKFCGAGAISMQERENYATLMRIAMLSALKAADTTNNMGFRCARSAGTAW
ncbi:MAG: formylglycine-generating enzyme family protein [Rhodanobacter sp.]